jgi:hypothetical protein
MGDDDRDLLAQQSVEAGDQLLLFLSVHLGLRS